MHGVYQIAADAFQAVDKAFQGVLNALPGVSRRAAILNLEHEMDNCPQIEQPLTHHFTDGLYGREIFNPKGCLIVTKEHRQANFSFILRGSLEVITEDGRKTLKAPAFFKTVPGTKRVLYSLEDTVFITVHPNPDDCQDLQTLETRITMREAV
jgi:quercetin dioxygenase-like cupin family protein